MNEGIAFARVLLGAGDYDADIAERYGWINRAMPRRELGDFVATLARRIAGFPAAGHAAIKNRVNAIALPDIDDLRRDSSLFADGVREAEYQRRMEIAMRRGFQTRDHEMSLAETLIDFD